MHADAWRGQKSPNPGAVLTESYELLNMDGRKTGDHGETTYFTFHWAFDNRKKCFRVHNMLCDCTLSLIIKILH